MIAVQSLHVLHIIIWNKCMSQGLNQYPVVTNANVLEFPYLLVD